MSVGVGNVPDNPIITAARVLLPNIRMQPYIFGKITEDIPSRADKLFFLKMKCNKNRIMEKKNFRTDLIPMSVGSN